MIKLGCLLKVSDNTGVSRIKFIGSLRRKKNLTIGDVVIGSIQKTTSNAYKKSSIVLGVLVKTKKPLQRSDGSTIRFEENCIIIVDRTLVPKGTHIFGPIPYEIKEKFKKITPLTNNFV